MESLFILLSENAYISVKKNTLITGFVVHVHKLLFLLELFGLDSDEQIHKNIKMYYVKRGVKFCYI